MRGGWLHSNSFVLPPPLLIGWVMRSGERALKKISKTYCTMAAFLRVVEWVVLIRFLFGMWHY